MHAGTCSSLSVSDELTFLLQQDDEQTRQDLQDLRHDHGRRGEEALARQRADVSDAEDERSILEHEHHQADVLSASC